MSFKTLISTDVLSARLADSAFVVVDCRFRLDDVGWGERAYAEHHIPGAVYCHLDRDLSGAKTGKNGRHPLPDPGDLAQTFGRLGIADGVQVVAYDQDNGSYASRLWWMLRWLGHDAAAVLDGGFAKWTAEGRATETGVRQPTPRAFQGTPHDDMVVSASDVALVAGRPDWRVIDARAPERYRGDVEPIDTIGGHIPGATNHFYQWNLDERGVFRTAAQLRDRAALAVGPVTPDHVVCYCGSGVTACHNLLAFEHAGLKGAKLYPGSWSEWSSDPSRLIEKG